MPREDIINLVIWTMTYYGSDARERAQPGSKLKSQADHIADVIEQYHEAQARINDLKYVTISILHHEL